MKTFSFVSTFLLFAFCSFGQYDYTRNIQNQICYDLLVGDFNCDNCSRSDNEQLRIGVNVRNDIMEIITKYKHCSIVSRDRIADILSLADNEKAITSIRDLSQAQVEKIININRAKRVLFGNIWQQDDGSLLITLEINNLQTTKVEGFKRFEIPKDKYPIYSARMKDVEKSLAELILGSQNAAIEPEALKPVADFTMSPEGCDMLPCTITFTSKSQNAEAYLWDFGDGKTSTEENTKHEYNKEGEYKITLTAKKGYLNNIISKNIKLEEKYVKDPDGNKYKIIKVKGKMWLAENIRFKVGNECRCYNDADVNCESFGFLYSSEAAVKACNKLGQGWRLPHEEDWAVLIEYFGGIFKNKSIDNEISNPEQVYKKMIEKDESGGFNISLGGMYVDKFYGLGSNGNYWYDMKGREVPYWVIAFTSDQGVSFFPYYWGPLPGASCRCIKD